MTMAYRCGCGRGCCRDFRCGCRRADHRGSPRDRRHGFDRDLGFDFGCDLDRRLDRRLDHDLDRRLDPDWHRDCRVVRHSLRTTHRKKMAHGHSRLDSCCDLVRRGDVDGDGGLRLHRDHHPSCSLGTRRTNRLTRRRSSRPSDHHPNPHQIPHRSNHPNLRSHQSRSSLEHRRHQRSTHEHRHHVRRDRGRDDVGDAFVDRRPRWIRRPSPRSSTPSQRLVWARQPPQHRMAACHMPCGSHRPARQSASTGGP